MGGKVLLRCKGKTLLGIVNKLLKIKSLLTSASNAIFCLITSSKFSRQWFEFSLNVKVMGSNPGYLLKYFLLCYEKYASGTWNEFSMPEAYFDPNKYNLMQNSILTFTWINLYNAMYRKSDLYLFYQWKNTIKSRIFS